MDKHISAPISDEDAKELRAGDYVYITGTIYTARDAAHKRMAEALAAGEPLPIDMKIILYITWDHLRQEKADQSVQQVRQLRAEWISMHRIYLIWDLKE